MEKDYPEIVKDANGLTRPDIFKYRVELEIQRAERKDLAFSLAVLHANTPKIKGVIYPKDILTPHIAKAVVATIRTLDVACIDDRGDYLILLTDTSDELAINAVKRLWSKLEFLHSKEVETNVSVGISNYPQDCKTYDELIQAAKYAMFQAGQSLDQKIMTIASIRQGVSWKKEADDALIETKKKFNLVIETTIKSLLSTFATKDPYLEKHSLEVSRIASIFAENVGLKENYVQEITLASLLHDVGNLEIPGSILLKPGPLNDVEWKMIKEHPVIAVEKILKPVKSLENILPIIEDHHERWDGSGYPNNKEQRHIHVGARILAIADAYQAMLSRRPYRAVRNQQEILEILQAGSDKHWDGHLIEAFFRLIEEKKI